MQLQPGRAQGDVQFLRPLKETLIPVYNHWAPLYNLPPISSQHGGLSMPQIDLAMIPTHLEISFSIVLGTMLFHTARTFRAPGSEQSIPPLRSLPRLGGVRKLEAMLEDMRSAFTTGERINKMFWRHSHHLFDVEGAESPFSFKLKEKRKVIELGLSPLAKTGPNSEELRVTLVQSAENTLVCERLESQTQFKYWIADVLQPDHHNDVRMSLRAAMASEIPSQLHQFAQQSSLSKDGMHLQSPRQVTLADGTVYKITYEKIVDAACYSVACEDRDMPLDLYISGVSGHQVLKDIYSHTTEVSLSPPRSFSTRDDNASAASLRKFGRVLAQWDDVIALCRVLSLPNLRR